MQRMFNPPHPGEQLREDVLPALGLSVAKAAAQLGVGRVTLSRVLHGHAAISPEMALRLEAWLGLVQSVAGMRASGWRSRQSMTFGKRPGVIKTPSAMCMQHPFSPDGGAARWNAALEGSDICFWRWRRMALQNWPMPLA